MSACSCCRRSGADVKPRRWLRTINCDGERTIRPFNGPLCDECAKRTQHIGSQEHRWLLKQVAEYDPLAYAERT